VGRFELWDVLRAGSLVLGRFESGTFQEQDVLYVHEIKILRN
jgi:hypothetical protein